MCTLVTKCPLPRVFYRSFKRFKIANSEFGTVSMCRQMHACADEYLAAVTESVVHSVYRVVTQSFFGVA